MGYAISYPWRIDSAPPLNALIDEIPADADVIYLHDLALHPEARGTGATREIVERLADQARSRGWPAMTLVAVNDAAGLLGEARASRCATTPPSRTSWPATGLTPAI
jgi:GNAT superfamily N-acetyltransferase